MRTCATCRYYQRDNVRAAMFDLCLHPRAQAVDPVRGEPVAVYCDPQRRDLPKRCGPDGANWTPRDGAKAAA